MTAAAEASLSLSPAHPAGTSDTAKLLFLILIVAMPVVTSPLMQDRLLDISGFKPSNMIAALAFAGFLVSGASLRTTDILQRRTLTVFGIYLIVFSVAFLRSLPNVARFHALFPDSFPAGVWEYCQTYYVVPLLFSFSFVYILQYMCSRDGLLQTVAAISLAVFILSCVVLAVMLTHPAVIMDLDPGREAINNLTSKFIGLHYNSAGTIYAITCPLLVYMALTRGSVWTLNLALALAAVLLLKSRTAIFTFAGMAALTFIALGRTRTLLAFAPVVAAGVLALLGKIVVQLLSIGFTKSGISTFALLSGREQAIWLPLLAEWISDPHRWLFGCGLFGVMTSDVLYSARSIFGAGRAHNFYLEFFLDYGVAGFGVFAIALVRWLAWSRRMGRRIHAQLYWVLFLCAISFLVAGFTGRRYIPEAENLLLFPIMATMINVARLKIRASPG